MNMGGVGEKVSTVRELLAFVWQGKIWWLTPLVFVLFLVSFVMFLVQGSAVAPFIYALF